MSDLYLKMREAEKDFEERVEVERRIKEDGERYATKYFYMNKKKMIEKILNSLISDMEHENQCETFVETIYIIKNKKYFDQSASYRAGFKEEMVKLVNESICELRPDFKENLHVIIKEDYAREYRIDIIVILRL